MSRYQRVPTEKLIVDERYQRPLDEKRVIRIVQGFDPALFGALDVSQRNGKSAVWDGQHRLAAARELGMDKVPCLVHTGLSPEREAELFVDAQQNRKRISSVERFRARVFAGDPVALEVQAVVDAGAFRIADGTSTSGAGTTRRIKSVATLERIHRRGGGLLVRTLELLEELWGGDDRSTDSGLIEGLALLIEGYDDGRLDEAALKRLRSVPPIQIVRRSMGRMTYASSKSSDRRLVVLAELRKVAGVRGRPAQRKPVAA